MGTSSAYGGPRGSTPLVPSWLEPDGPEVPAPPEPPDHQAPPDGPPADSVPGSPPATLLPPVPADVGRFTAARSNFSRFASSGGTDRASLGRAVSHYVSRASG